MPVHWYYDVGQLRRDFGQIKTYEAPKEKLRGSIMSLSSTGGGGRGSDKGTIIGDVILHGKRKYWQRSVLPYCTVPHHRAPSSGLSCNTELVIARGQWRGLPLPPGHGSRGEPARDSPSVCAVSHSQAASQRSLTAQPHSVQHSLMFSPLACLQRWFFVPLQENTLELTITRQCFMDSITATGGVVDGTDVRARYIELMTTPDSHNDTYAGTVRCCPPAVSCS